MSNEDQGKAGELDPAQQGADQPGSTVGIDQGGVITQQRKPQPEADDADTERAALAQGKPAEEKAGAEVIPEARSRQDQDPDRVDLGAEAATLQGKPKPTEDSDGAKQAAQLTEQAITDGAEQAGQRAAQPIAQADQPDANDQRQPATRWNHAPMPTLDTTGLPDAPIGGIEAYFEAREARIVQWVHELMTWHGAPPPPPADAG